MQKSRMSLQIGTGALAAVLLMTASLVSAGTWLEVDASGTVALKDTTAARAAELTVSPSDLTGFRVVAEVHGLTLDPYENEHGQFVKVSWPDAPRFGGVGTPGLPLIRRLFVAPQGAAVSFDVELGAAITIDGDAAGMPLWLLPVQPPLEKVPGARENAVFELDEQAYQTDAELPAERVEVQELGIVRGQRVWLLEIRPVAYNPVTQTLSLFPTIVADVQFDDGDRKDDPYAPISPLPGLDRVVLNPEVLPATPARGSGNYLIVVASAYETAITTFANAKVAQGFNVMTHSVPSGTSAQEIKNYIESLWGGPEPPDYVLLVGDTNTIPAWTGGGSGSPDTDLPYACMDGAGDWYPDIAIGRFPVRSTGQLQDVVEKTLYYEDGPLSDPDYLLRAVFMASEDNYGVSEGTHNWVIDNYLDPNGYTSDKLYCHTYNATTQQVRDAFNDGRFFGIYSGHGSTTGWYDGPPFSQTDVNNLFNENMYAFVCSFACLTGDFVYGECFMETWILAEDKGAITAWGSSVSSYWDEDDILEKVLFDSIFDDEVLSEVGPIFNDTKMRYLDYWGASSTTRRYFEMYNLMGDPSLWVISEPAPPTGLGVTPAGGLHAEGQQGGPFTPDSIEYTLENRDETPIDYEVAKSVNWVDITDGSGTIPPLSSVLVTVSINSNANSLGNGFYEDTVYFTNLTNHDGDTARPVTLKVGVATLQYAWNMDTDPGWATEGDWAWGQPTGQGGEYGYPDPTSGYTGPNVYGYNLNGDYPNNLPERHLTSGPADCTDLAEVSLRFWRWLGVEQPTYDHAYIGASNDGTSWTNVWQNTAEVTDSSWKYQELDISDVANDQPTVYLRWTMGTTDSGWRYCGWNIDDIEIWALAAGEPILVGDLNCDGEVDFNDINPFVLALTDLPAYELMFPGCPFENRDINADGEFDFGDINPFVELLADGA